MEENSSWHEQFRQEAMCRRWLMPLRIDASGRQAASVIDNQGTGFAEAEWSEEEVVLLHWQLLERIRLLQDTHAALEEKIDILQWMFTDTVRDQLPFSFVNCVRVVCISPLSPTPCFIGAADPEEIRNWVRCRLARWFSQSLEGYPAWVRDAVVEQPGWIAKHLERNPQWLNQQIRRTRIEGDLFA